LPSEVALGIWKALACCLDQEINQHLALLISQPGLLGIGFKDSSMTTNMMLESTTRDLEVLGNLVDG